MVIYWACFTNRPDNVARVLEWMPAEIKVHFLVGRGQAKEFMMKGLQKDLVIECGTATDCFNFACSLRRPVLFMADDIMHIYGLDAAPAAWVNSNGRNFSPASMATKMKQEAEMVGAKFVGLYPKAKAVEALQLPQWQLSHFIVADFCLIMPGFKATWIKTSWPKEDLDCSAAALQHHGCTLRLNRFMIDAKHHQAGGDCAGRRGKSLMKQQPNG